MTLPRIHLAVDNCFASKRWTEPIDWMQEIRDLGLSCVEASADTECDPLYMGGDYLHDWVHKVRDAQAATGVRVVNLYSGHGTYATTGLAHEDVRIRDRFLHEWLMPMSETAATLDAGLGFFCHAFSDRVLQDPTLYANAENDLYDRLARLAAHARACGCGSIGVEQMYTPHQIPWTIAGARRLLAEVNARSGAPFYITIDVGHQSGQRLFLRPSRADLTSLAETGHSGLTDQIGWLGPQSAWRMFADILHSERRPTTQELDATERLMDRYPYLFATYDDGDPYAWLSELACYSPIIHLQQTPGTTSSHWPFTAEFNARGIIEPERILRAISEAYRRPAPEAPTAPGTTAASQDLPASGTTAAPQTPRAPGTTAAIDGLPPRCGDIYLTLEMFSSTVDTPQAIRRRMKDSTDYWRRFVPRDGLRLDQLL